MAITLDTINASLHSIAISDGTDTLAIAADGSIAVTDNGASLTVDAVNLDIRDLAFATDSVTAVVSDGTDTIAIAADGSIAVTDNGTTLSIDDGAGSITVDGSVTVSATDLDIRDLTHVSDSVKIGDGTDLLAVNADGSINVSGTFVSTSSGYDTWQVSSDTVTNTASQLDGTPLAGRLRCEIQNLGTVDVYIGPSNAVTTSNGLKIAKGTSQDIELDDGAQIWAITASGSADIRLAEYSA